MAKLLQRVSASTKKATFAMLTGAILFVGGYQQSSSLMRISGVDWVCIGEDNLQHVYVNTVLIVPIEECQSLFIQTIPMRLS